MIKVGDIVICTRLDYLDGNGNYAKLTLTIGKIYKVKNVGANHINIEGWSFGLDETDYTYLRYYKDYFITYNEWLALEREKQIKSLIDDNN